MNLKDILEQPAGFVAPSLRCKIDKAWDRKTGDGQNGPWSLQGISVVDEQGNKGRLTVKNMAPFPTERQGQWCTLKSVSGKHGLNGLKVNHDTRDNKTYSEIMVSSVATWEWDADGGSAGSQPASSNAAPSAAGSPAAPSKNAAEQEAAWRAHVVETAKLAAIATREAGISDHAAISNVFACLIIGSKERGIWLSAPANRNAGPVQPPKPEREAPQQPQGGFGAPGGAPMDDDVPFSKHDAIF